MHWNLGTKHRLLFLTAKIIFKLFTSHNIICSTNYPGGNFQPVAAVCKYSEWTKCFLSFFEYIWFEVVTDVADCLANDTILWRILAIIFIFLTIAYLAHWKIQWTKEVKRNREKFKTVNHKIQDIELKVDIITYKTQYGIWPQCLQENNTSAAHVRNYQLGLSRFTLENSWIKNLLARADKKKCALEKYQFSSIHGPIESPSEYDSKLLSDAERDDEILKRIGDGRLNSLIIPPESNLSDRSKNYNLYMKENIGVYNRSLSRPKSITFENYTLGQKKLSRNKDLKIISSTKNMMAFSKDLLPEMLEKSCNTYGKTSSGLSSKSHSTLLDVQKKLETLYTTIHNCNTNHPLVPLLALDSDSAQDHISETVVRAIGKNSEDVFLLEDSNKHLEDINQMQNVDEHPKSTTKVTRELKSLNKVEVTINDNHKNGNNAEETFDTSQKCIIQDGKNDGDISAKTYEIEMCKELLDLHSVILTDRDNILENEAPSESFQGVTSLDDTTSALLQEALKFKMQILSKAEIHNNEIDNKEDCPLNCSETTSDSSLRQSNVTFESKTLDMITEESSVSSCTEKKSDLHSLKIFEKNETSQDKSSVPSEKTKRSASKNTIYNFELLTDEKAKKQKEVNSLMKVSIKSGTAESSSSRKFPSCFSSILLCNDQDNTSHCKQSQDNSTTLDPKSSEDLISLTESSSDVSVNELITKLIENERKSKSSNQSLEPENTLMNVPMQDFISSHDVKLLHSPISSASPTIDYVNTVVQGSKKESTIVENIKYRDFFNEDSSTSECLREIQDVAKKAMDSVHDIKNRKSSKMKCQHLNIINITETSDIDSSIGKCENYSDSSALEKSTKLKFSSVKLYDAPLATKESEDTFHSISSTSVQKTSTKYNFEYNNRKPYRAQSNLDLATLSKRQFKSAHRRTRSYVNPRGIDDEPEYDIEKEHFVEPMSTSTVVKVFINDIQNDLKNEADIERNKSSESLSSKSSSNSIQKLITSKDGRTIVTKDCSDPMAIDQIEKNYVKNENSLEMIPLLPYSSSKSCIPVMKDKISPCKNEEIRLCAPAELSTDLSQENKTQSLICQADTDRDEICSLPVDEEKAYPEKCTNFSELGNLKDIEQNAITYYNLISEERLNSNYINHKKISHTTIEELNIPDKVLCSIVNNAASSTTETINRPITCMLSDERISELNQYNPLNSIVLQNTMPSISPYKIERKETEVLVKPSTLDISTSMTNFPCVYHFEDSKGMNDVKIFEISDELTKEECIRYLQMFDQDSNHDQSTNTNDFFGSPLENL